MFPLLPPQVLAFLSHSTSFFTAGFTAVLERIVSLRRQRVKATFRRLAHSHPVF
ncbi:hypothetical protein L210DRAFT_3525413 [Boletus edulis BED1]|uniref:Uncharacterized protein n=1 Tax=Boletus edulis BED1 TaxID=1328754 RepID=A0AAD4GJ68_BOLED|nr:hypothetical protein L210DRAFT_3525413 [Boletus edulis BED1]